MILYRQAEKGDDHLVPVRVWVVPIEPCEHGNYARHLLTVLENHERVWCSGKPGAKGDNE